MSFDVKPIILSIPYPNSGCNSCSLVAPGNRCPYSGSVAMETILMVAVAIYFPQDTDSLSRLNVGQVNYT